LVAQHQLAALIEPELELRVRQDHAALARVLGREGVQLDRAVARLLHQRAVADQLARALEVDRLVMALQRLRARGDRKSTRLHSTTLFRSASSPSTSSPRSSSPNSNFVSAKITPRSRACSAAKEYSSIELSRACSISAPSPTSSRARSKSIASSWPSSAFVLGVKIGCGRRSDSRRPSGSAIPDTLPLAW